MSERNRTWVHPNAISYEYEHDGKKGKLHYFRRWQKFDLTLENYTVTRHVLGQNSDADPDDQGLLRRFKNDREQQYDSLSEEEKTAFADRQLTYVQTYEERENLRLEGWAQIEKDSLTAFSVKKDEQVDPEDGVYEKKFRQAKISIQSHSEDQPGSLLLWTTELQQLGSDPGDPDEDFLVAELYMEKSKLMQVVEDLSGISEKPPLTIHLQALLFQDEVEASLSEPWHPQEYAFIYTHDAPIIVDRLTYRLIETDRRLRDADESNVLGNEETAVGDKFIKPPIQAAQKAFEPMGGDIAGQMRGVKRAILILAVAIILAAVITG